MPITGERRCERKTCNKRLFDMQNLVIAQGGIIIKCKCGHMNAVGDVSLDTLNTESLT